MKRNNDDKILDHILDLKPVLWRNTHKLSSEDILPALDLSYQDIIAASQRLKRFEPLISRLFPETVNGIIESPLIEIPKMKKEIGARYKRALKGKLYLKCDNHLKIAGSIKARGGIYEVLKHAEDLAIKNGLLTKEDEYSKLAEEKYQKFFSRYKIAVGSTGNLGLSIGITAAALGFSVTVHMSSDAKEWKKRLLRSKGVTIIEYEEDYSKAVAVGRKECQEDPRAYFIDDENSKDLFLGYSVAALRLKNQLEELSITVNDSHPLIVFLPCGVGGAPGGITFGLKHIFRDHVYCYFAEPTHSPCMLLGILTGKYDRLHVREYGIDNVTEADGLAVGSPSKLAARIVDKMIDGIYTIDDDDLFKLLTLLKDTEGIKIEPSAAAGLLGPVILETKENAAYISWATGGLLLPDDTYLQLYKKGQRLLEKCF